MEVDSMDGVVVRERLKVGGREGIRSSSRMDGQGERSSLWREGDGWWLSSNGSAES